MAETLRHLHVVLEDDGSIRSSTADYVDAQADAPDRPAGRRRLSESDLAKALPDRAALLAQLDAEQAAHAETKAERDALMAEHGPKPRYLPKTLVIQRLAAQSLADAAWRALEADAALMAAWNEAGQERLNVADERVAAFIAALGADPDTVLAVA